MRNEEMSTLSVPRHATEDRASLKKSAISLIMHNAIFLRHIRSREPRHRQAGQARHTPTPAWQQRHRAAVPANNASPRPARTPASDISHLTRCDNMASSPAKCRSKRQNAHAGLLNHAASPPRRHITGKCERHSMQRCRSEIGPAHAQQYRGQAVGGGGAARYAAPVYGQRRNRQAVVVAARRATQAKRTRWISARHRRLKP